MTVCSISIRLQSITTCNTTHSQANERQREKCWFNVYFLFSFFKAERTKRYATQTCVEHPSNNRYYMEFVSLFFFNFSIIAIIRLLLHFPLSLLNRTLYKVILLWIVMCFAANFTRFWQQFNRFFFPHSFDWCIILIKNFAKISNRLNWFAIVWCNSKLIAFSSTYWFIENNFGWISWLSLCKLFSLSAV